MSKYIKQDKAIKIVKSHYRVDNDLLEVIAYQISNLPAEDVQPVVRWIPCSVINSCFIPELQDFPYGGLLFTYVTQKGKRLVRETWIERGRIVGKKMNGTPIAYMPLPEPYQGEGEQG